MDLLNKKTGKWQRRIFLVTDAGMPVNNDGLNLVVDQFARMDAKLNIMCVLPTMSIDCVTPICGQRTVDCTLTRRSQWH